MQPLLPLEPERVLVTGSRDLADPVLLSNELFAEVRAILYERAAMTMTRGTLDEMLAAARRHVAFVLGDCPSGADRLALGWCEAHGFAHARLEVDYRDGDEKCHRRNQNMVDLGGRPTRFVAFWDAPGSPPDGTFDMVRRCVRAKVPGRIVPV
jgi:hypothetical protein